MAKQDVLNAELTVKDGKTQLEEFYVGNVL